MSDHVYLLCLDPLRARQQEDFEAFLDESSQVVDWLHDIPGCYYIKSAFDEIDLTDMIQDALSYPRSFLLTKLDPGFNGLLSEQSWKFLRQLNHDNENNEYEQSDDI